MHVHIALLQQWTVFLILFDNTASSADLNRISRRLLLSSNPLSNQNNYIWLSPINFIYVLSRFRTTLQILYPLPLGEHAPLHSRHYFLLLEQPRS